MHRRPTALVLVAASIVLQGVPRTSRAADGPGTSLTTAVQVFLDAPTPEARAKEGAALVATGDFDGIATRLANGREHRKDVPTGWLERAQRCPDGKDRPYLLYVPPDYDPAKAYRFVIELHGGVSRPQVLSKDDFEEMKQLRAAHAEEHAYLYAMPSGESGAEWWTPVGAGNVLGILDAVRRTWHVDRDRVFVTGFSDGASGSYYLALTHPTPFAGFVPLNGHLAVAQAGGLQVHLRTLLDRPVYAVNTDLDSLYPSVGVAPIADALKALGAPFQWHEVKGFAHDPSYLGTERAPIWAWEQGVVRDPRPRHLWWEGAADAPSRVHGLGRVEVAATGKGPTFPDVNPALPPGRARLGVVVDTAWTGEGVRIAQVNEGSPAAAAGLAPGDVLVRVGDTAVRDARALRGALGAVAHGSTVRVEAKRGDATVTKDVTFPPETKEPAFRRTKPRGTVEVVRDGNAFTVACRDVKAFELWLEVGAVDFAAPVVVTVNGTVAHRGVVAKDLAFLVERAAEDDDPGMLYGARLRVAVP